MRGASKGYGFCAALLLAWGSGGCAPGRQFDSIPARAVPTESNTDRVVSTETGRSKVLERSFSEERTDRAFHLPATLDRDPAAIVHALNRFGYGPRPGDVQSIRNTGLSAWIGSQLQPETLDDSAVEARLARYPTLSMDPLEILSTFPPRQLVEATVRLLRDRMDYSEDEIWQVFPAAASVLKENTSGATSRKAPNKKALDPAKRMASKEGAGPSPTRLVTELRHAKIVRAIFSERQLQEVMTDFWYNHFNVYANKGASRWWVTSYERDAIRPHALGNFRELLGATARHPAMLIYLDNWISAAKGSRAYGLANQVPAAKRIAELGLPAGGLPVRFLKERGIDTIELEASIATRMERRIAAEADRGRRPKMDDPNQRRGLNENYARELLELHTLGVSGGYTQQDIVDVARCFTGWTILPREAGQGFVFMDEWHDDGPKSVLGHTLQSHGIGQGEEVLDLLAAHPSTAKFISRKIARRFVSDEPPQALVDRMAETFIETEGDIRSVLMTLIESPEFWSEEAFRAKVKSPLEYIASMARATDARINPHTRLLETAAELTGMDVEADPNADDRLAPPAIDRFIRNMGQPLYLSQPPTGFDETAEAWISAGSMLDRFKVAMRFAGNRLGGVEIEIPAVASQATDAATMVRELGLHVFGVLPNDETLGVIVDQLTRSPDEWTELGFQAGFGRSKQGRAKLALGWLLASPEFQRR